MSHFDISYTIPIFINCLKFKSEAPSWEFDPFHVLDPNQTSLATISFHVFMLYFFSFTSITIFPTLRPRLSISVCICFKPEAFSPHNAVSLFASLFLPQTLFWFLYPYFLFLNHLHGRSSSTPTYDHQEDDIDIEAQTPVHPVPVDPTDHISPEDEDGDSHRKANDENMEALTTASVTQSREYEGRNSSILTYDHQEDDIDTEAQTPVHPVPVDAADHISPEDDGDGDGSFIWKLMTRIWRL